MKKDEKKITESISIHIRIPTKLLDRIDAFAEKRGMDRSNLIRMAVIEHMEKREKTE